MSNEKKRLTYIGFFVEHWAGDSPSLLAARRVIMPEEDKIVGYLESGLEFAIVMGKRQRDQFAQDGRLAGDGDLLVMTDGVWAWPSHLAYYVANYHIELPTEFWDHARNNSWEVPNDVDLSMIE